MRRVWWGRFLEVLMLGALAVWLAASALHRAGLDVTLPLALLAAVALPLPLAVWLASRRAERTLPRRTLVWRARRARRTPGRTVLARPAGHGRVAHELRPRDPSGRQERW